MVPELDFCLCRRCRTYGIQCSGNLYDHSISAYLFIKCLCTSKYNAVCAQMVCYNEPCFAPDYGNTGTCEPRYSRSGFLVVNIWRDCHIGHICTPNCEDLYSKSIK